MSSKRKSLTLRERVECLKLLDMGMHARDIANEFGVGRTQVMMIRKRKNEIMHQYESNVNLNMKRAASVRDTVYSELNSLVYNWLLDAKARQMKVTGYVVQQKARKFANDLGLNEFKGSQGWLCGFLRRNNIELKSSNIEVDHYDIQEWNDKVMASLEQYSPENIFAMAEFGLFFKDSTESLKRGKTCAGGDLADQRITVALCSSMTGEKLTPLVIGKFLKSNFFTDVSGDELPVQYETNDKAWMFTPLMKDWLKLLNCKMQAKNRKILLFLNSSPVHPSLTFSNVTLQFIPAKSIMELQPMNAGIIQSVKSKYRIHQLQHVLQEMDKNPTKLGPEILHEISILDAINWVSAAWQETDTDTIVKCFVKCGFNTECVSTSGREDNVTSELNLEDKYPPELHKMSLELFNCYITELTAIDEQFVTCGNEMIEWDRPAQEILSCPNIAGQVLNRDYRVSSSVNPDLHHITMLVSSEQEDSIRMLFRDKKWPCILKVLSDENVGNLIQSGFTDLFPTMERDSTSETEFTEIKTEVVDEDEIAAEDDNSYMHASNFSGTDSIDNATDSGLTADKLDINNKIVDMHDKSGDEPCDIIQDNVGIESNDKIQKRTGVESYDMIQEQIKVEPIDINSENVQDDMAEDNNESSFSSFQEEMWKHRLVAYHEPHVISSTSEGSQSQNPEKYIAMGHIKCEYCSDFFPHHRSLKRHMYAVHRDVLPKWKCAVCGDEFDSRDELWVHKRQSQHGSTMSNAPNYQCESCGRIFTRCSSFKEHKVSCKTQEEAAMETTEFPCEVCGMLFKSMARVKRHKRQVHIIAPVMCNICGETCKNRRSLLSHKRRHDSKNRKYGCDECGKTFFNNTLLTQHIRTHTKEKPYKCPICNYRCAIKQNIHKHAQKVHKTAAKAVDLTNDVSVSDSANNHG